MRRKQALSQTQQRAVERLAKGQGCSCIECGSADYLVSGTNALLSFANINVALFCKNPDAEHPDGVLALGQSFPLSFAQAEAIGLTVPPEEPPHGAIRARRHPAPNAQRECREVCERRRPRGCSRRPRRGGTLELAAFRSTGMAGSERGGA